MHQAEYPVATMCRVLGVSTSGYYAWLKREPSQRAKKDAALLERIRVSHKESRGTYGSPRIHEDLKAEGIRVGRKRVARIMKKAGLVGVSRRKSARTTRKDARARPAPDLVNRDFEVDGPERLWVADITYVPTWAGFLYLAVVIDAWNRRVVGWAMAGHVRTELVLQALNMAIWQRRPEGVIPSLRPGEPVYLGRLWFALPGVGRAPLDGFSRRRLRQCALRIVLCHPGV